MLAAGRIAARRSISPQLARSTSTSASTATPSNRENQTLKLPDGRNLGYAEYGTPNGSPVFFIHGVPDSRISIRTTDKIAKKLDVRFIGIDRPGIGLSTCYPNRKVTDWPADLQHLVDHLNVDQYRIASVSGGTGYALACAKALPKEKLRAVGVICGIGPWEAGTKGMSLANRVALNVWAYAPRLVRAVHDRWVLPIVRDPDPTKWENAMKKNLKYFKESDRKEFEKPGEFELLCDIFREVWKQGMKGHIEELRLITRHWGFDLEDVKHDKIKFWVGSEDVNTPPRHTEYMAKRLPSAEFKLYPGLSHFTVWAKMEEILSELLEE